MIGEAVLALPQIPLTQTDPTDPVVIIVIMNMTRIKSESAKLSPRKTVSYRTATHRDWNPLW